MNPIPLQFIGVYLSDQSPRKRQSVASVGVVDAHGRLLFCSAAPLAPMEQRKLPDPSWILDVLHNQVGPCIEPWSPVVFSSVPDPRTAAAQERPTVAASASSSLLTTLRFCRFPVERVGRKPLADWVARGGRKAANRRREDEAEQRFRHFWANREFPGEAAAMAALLAEFGREKSQERIAS